MRITDPDWQTRVLVTAGAAWLLLMAWVHRWRKGKELQKLKETRGAFLMKLHYNARAHNRWFVAIALGVGVMGISKSWPDVQGELVPIGPMMALVIVFGFVTQRFPAAIYEKGVVVYGTFKPWSDVTSFFWSDSGNGLLYFVIPPPPFTKPGVDPEFRVPPAERARVDEILLKYIPRSGPDPHFY